MGAVTSAGLSAGPLFAARITSPRGSGTAKLASGARRGPFLHHLRTPGPRGPERPARLAPGTGPSGRRVPWCDLDHPALSRVCLPPVFGPAFRDPPAPPVTTAPSPRPPPPLASPTTLPRN